MTGTNYAYIEERSAWLSTEFGEKARKFIDDLPRYVRGKRKGQLKGQFNKKNLIILSGLLLTTTGYVSSMIRSLYKEGKDMN